MTPPRRPDRLDLKGIVKDRARQVFGPHGIDPQWLGLYMQAARYVGDWLKRDTPRALCAAINRGEPVVHLALQQINDDAMDIMRRFAGFINAVTAQDIDVIIDRIAGQAPLHHAILTARPGSPCPFCHQSHIEWTREQFAMAILELRNALAQGQDGTPGA